MASKHLTNLTAEDRSSFGGVSVTDFINQWDQSLFQTNEMLSDSTSAPNVSRSVGTLRFTPSTLETVGPQEFVSQNEALIRLLSKRLIDLIPQEGLIELVEQLFELFTFYSERAGTAPQLPAPTPSFSVTMGPVVTRTPFSLEDDE